MLVVPNHLIEQMNAHVEKAYPEEGAGFLLGTVPSATFSRAKKT